MNGQDSSMELPRLRANFAELELLIKKCEPIALRLQELQISDSYTLDKNPYTLLFYHT